MWEAPTVWLGPRPMIVRRCPTLPHPPGCSTIGAVGLSFRVRNGTGRFPHAMTAVTLLPGPTLGLVGNLYVVTTCGVVFNYGLVPCNATHPWRVCWLGTT